MKTIHEIKQEFSSTGAGISNSYNAFLDEIMGQREPEEPQEFRNVGVTGALS
jgi:hypothetical protein